MEHGHRQRAAFPMQAELGRAPSLEGRAARADREPAAWSRTLPSAPGTKGSVRREWSRVRVYRSYSISHVRRELCKGARPPHFYNSQAPARGAGLSAASHSLCSGCRVPSRPQAACL